ncbi:hypothetical protein [Culicoidibacter larvae]|uniref:Uncharacterized protein n=1 Tax=Culicoidibacter larvae TaxID=2579976 RepID=A0A5R8Q844_9FIRM|nr:hypothetical protein [Culicoidibacter larvae]TLG71754.1 hypothetical protein FEZ08_10110 [Culicoidibacter larvae]
MDLLNVDRGQIAERGIRLAIFWLLTSIAGLMSSSVFLLLLFTGYFLKSIAVMMILIVVLLAVVIAVAALVNRTMVNHSEFEVVNLPGTNFLIVTACVDIAGIFIPLAFLFGIIFSAVAIGQMKAGM